MKKKLFITFGFVALILITFMIYSNFFNKQRHPSVSSEDFELNVLNVEENQNIYLVTVEIINNSQFGLESNHIIIGEINRKKQNEEFVEIIESSSGNSNGDTVRYSSFTVDSIDDEQPKDILITNIKGDYNKIRANDSVQIILEYELEDLEANSLYIALDSYDLRIENWLSRHFLRLDTSITIRDEP